MVVACREIDIKNNEGKIFKDVVNIQSRRQFDRRSRTNTASLSMYEL